jgi:putative membrane protein
MTDWGWDGHMGAGGWLLMTLLWVALLGTVVWAITRIVPPRGPGESAAEILDRRLARGEIGADEYDALRAKLRAPSAGG